MSQETQQSQATAGSQSKSKSPEEIRDEIEQTREELGDTVQALAAKTDVKAQAQNRIAAVKHSISSNVAEVTQTAAATKQRFAATAKQPTPASSTTGAERLGSTVQANPIPFVAIAGFTLGLSLGWRLARR
jgi:hypothetical protein